MSRSAGTVIVAIAAICGSARADFIQVFERNSDTDLNYFTFDSLAAVAAGTPNAPVLVNDFSWSTDFNLADLAFDGIQYIQVFERNSDTDLFYYTFDSLADLAAGTPNGPALGNDFSWSTDFNLAGLAFDGLQYIQVFERNSDTDLFYYTFDSLAALAAGTPNGPALGNDFSWSTDFNVAGLAFDGTQFIQAFERNSDTDLFYYTFDSLADLAAGTPNGPALGNDFSWSTDFNLAGLAFDSKFTPIPEPETLLLTSMGIALFSVCGAGSRRALARTVSAR